ncbi:hypothetical protein D6745_00920 [Candidatus Woesearchaeota archaeon]|nr:MAG: hypothetical protein D6745_00920 [Candidatus Woesearchaeota archaeon]
MSNSLVSIRIPYSLFQELKEAAKKDHFLDVSEAVRSIVRKKWLEEKDPQLFELRKLRKEISSKLKEKSHDQLVEELRRIRDSIIKDETE